MKCITCIGHNLNNPRNDLEYACYAALPAITIVGGYAVCKQHLTGAIELARLQARA